MFLIFVGNNRKYIINLYFILSGVGFLFLIILTKFSGAEFRRFYFNLAGPFSCILAGYGLNNFLKKYLS